MEADHKMKPISSGVIHARLVNLGPAKPRLFADDFPGELNMDDKCDHVWKRVADPTTPSGWHYLVCDKCNKTRLVRSPVKTEDQKNEKPLLME